MNGRPENVCRKAKWFITVDMGREILFVKMSGAFDKKSAEDFVKEVIWSLTITGTLLGRHDTLCDISEAALLDKETAAHFQLLLFRAHKSMCRKRTAIVTTSALAELQARRLIKHGSTSCFPTVSEALSWIMLD